MKTLLLILCTMMVASCEKATSIFAEGPMSTRTQQFAGFNKVSITGHFTVDLSKGEHSVVNISVQNSVMPYIESYVVDSVLYLKYKDGIVVNGDVKLTIDATTQSVESLECHDWGTIICNDITSNPSNRVLAPNLTLRSDSRGSMMLYGTVNNLYLYATLGSDFWADDLVVTDFADINLGDVSSGDFNLNGIVDATLTGQSTLEYCGTPTFRKVDISSDSKLVKLQ